MSCSEKHVCIELTCTCMQRPAPAHKGWNLQKRNDSEPLCGRSQILNKWVRGPNTSCTTARMFVEEYGNRVQAAHQQHDHNLLPSRIDQLLDDGGTIIAQLSPRQMRRPGVPGGRGHTVRGGSFPFSVAVTVPVYNNTHLQFFFNSFLFFHSTIVLTATQSPPLLSVALALLLAYICIYTCMFIIPKSERENNIKFNTNKN